jgi:hypothetical protein
METTPFQNVDLDFRRRKRSDRRFSIQIGNPLNGRNERKKGIRCQVKRSSLGAWRLGFRFQSNWMDGTWLAVALYIGPVLL